MNLQKVNYFLLLVVTYTAANPGSKPYFNELLTMTH